MNNTTRLNRRDFIADSAKIGAGLALFGGEMLFGTSGKAIDSSTNLGSNSNANQSMNPSFTLNNGVVMPATGFGTLKLGDTATTQKAVEEALEAGIVFLTQHKAMQTRRAWDSHSRLQA